MTVVERDTAARVYLCPPEGQVPLLLDKLRALVGRVPAANRERVAASQAIHAFDSGNSRLSMALALGRTIAAAHPAVAPAVVDTAYTRWDGFFSGYDQAWLNAVGPAYEPWRDVTSWVEWYVTAEARLMAVAALAG